MARMALPVMEACYSRELQQPVYVAADQLGNVYIRDYNIHRYVRSMQSALLPTLQVPEHRDFSVTEGRQQPLN